MSHLIYIPPPYADQPWAYDWNGNMPQWFQDNGYEVLVPEVPNIRSASETVLNYARRLDLLLTLSKATLPDDTIIFFADLHDSVIFDVAKVLMRRGLPYKITGFFHDGSWDRCSEYRRHHESHWAREMEKGIIKRVDQVLVPTKFHKNMVNSRCSGQKRDADKLIVSGFPIFEALSEMEAQGRKVRNRILFRHVRSHTDMINLLRDTDINCDIWADREYGKHRFTQYRRAKIIFSDNLSTMFDSTLLEASLFNCIPIVPNNGYHPEIFAENILYNQSLSTQKIIALISDIFDNYADFDNKTIRYDPKKPLKYLLENVGSLLL